MNDARTTNAPGIGGPSDETGYYDDPAPVPSGDRCEEPGCDRAALPRQCGCLIHGACELCGEGTEDVGPIVIRSDGIARCVACAVLPKAVAS